ncbi:MAG TPA: GNAT family N-acetyltransferase [Anaerolineales bacterium]|nr:GNAT family N-acetyltransferase [Anaerolineales bacterium]
MDTEQLLRLYDHDQRIEGQFPNLHREVLPNVIRNIPLTAGEDGFIAYSSLTTENADETIRRQIDHFTSLGLSFEWKLYGHDTPADLKDRLARHGFEIGEEEAIMALEVEHAPVDLRAPVPASIQKVTDPSQIATVIALEDQVWGYEHRDLHAFLEKMMHVHPEQISIYLAYADDKPAAAGWTYLLPGSRFASLWGGSTLPEYRRRGLYTGLLAVRLQEAQKRGYEFLTVDASPMSRPILEKLGFKFLTLSYACEYKVK